jgi:uncharacterized peroxidase-related enzyme
LVDQNELVDNISNNIDKANLSEQDSIMLQYAKKLTLEPKNIIENDIIELKKAGFSEIAIHDICAIVSYFNFVNRIADGLGIEMENRFI